MGISCRQFRFRRECLVIRPSAAEIAPQGHFLALRAQGATAPLGPRNDKSGSIAPLNSCHQYCQPAWRPERRYRRNRCIPFYRQPLRIDSIAPGGACPSPTTHTWRLCKTFPFPFSIFHFPSSVSAALHYKKGRTCSPALLYIIISFSFSRGYRRCTCARRSPSTRHRCQNTGRSYCP